MNVMEMIDGLLKYEIDNGTLNGDIDTERSRLLQRLFNDYEIIINTDIDANIEITQVVCNEICEMRK